MPKEKTKGRVKDRERYEKLKKKGMSKQKAARIANTPRKKAGKKGGKSEKYEDWKKEDLLKKAKKIGLDVKTSMTKKQIISKLRKG